MRKTLVALLVALFVVATSRAGTPPASGVHLELVEGTLVQEAGRAEVFLVDRGTLRHITGDAFDRIYRDFRRVVTVVRVPRHLVGQPLGNGTRLVRGKGDPAVWLIDNGETKRHVANEPSFRGRGFVWSKVQIVDPGEIDFLPIGPRLD
ncbi:MAG: hypothetical protein AAGD14_00570 [Planctomycetota bacterium]